MGSQITPTGIRWQVWLSVFGGLGVLAYVAFVMTSGKPEQQEREDDLPVVQKRRSSSSVNWGPSGYRRRAQKLRAVSARPSQRAKAPTRARVVDGGLQVRTPESRFLLNGGQSPPVDPCTQQVLSVADR